MNKLKEKIQQKAKTRKELVKTHNKELEQYTRELQKAEGVIAIKSADVRFAQKDNEEWIEVKALLQILKEEFIVASRKKLEEDLQWMLKTEERKEAFTSRIKLIEDLLNNEKLKELQNDKT